MFFYYVYILLLRMMSVARVIMDAEGRGASEINGKRKKAASGKENEGENDV